jgi:ATP-dependent DNA helicase RecG
MEVSSPGGLVAEVRIEDLRERHRVHRSRNPRIVRALVDLGLMRDQGEGLPRVFAEMEGLFLPAPEIETSSYQFKMMLRNTPTLTREDERFLGLLGTEAFEAHEFRAMLQAFRSGRVDNASMRHITGLDTLRASRILRTLRDRDLLVLHAAGANSYFELSERLLSQAATAQALQDGAPGDRERTPSSPGRNSRQSGGELPSVQAGTPVNPEGNSRQLRQELPSVQAGTPVTLSAKPSRAGKIREQIRAFCSDDWKTPAEIGQALSIRSAENLTRRHLGPMVEARLLERRHAEKNHPAQAYRAVKVSTAIGGIDDEG